MKKNVLVFPCGSEIGLEIYRSLFASTHFELFGGSSVSDHGEYVYQNYIGDMPPVDGEGFVAAINKVVSEQGIDFIVPAHDSVVLKLAEAADSGKLNCELVTSPLETCTVARSKRQTYQRLSDIIDVPKVYKPSEIKAEDFPVFLKPDVGQGSKGTYLAKSQAEVDNYLGQDPGLMVLEYLPGDEYTIDCFTDKDGKLLFSEGRHRNRILNGISVNSTKVVDERFKQIAEKINQNLKFHGAWFFQIKKNKPGDLVLLEIAPRIAGAMALARCKGVNLAMLSLFDRLGYKLDIFENAYAMTIDRALQNNYRHNINYRHVYLDFDDLVIVEGKVNPAVMAFVYQCMNKEVKVHLITRHKADLEASLKAYRLTEVFDDIIWIKNDDEKHSFIKEDDAIFIDDSFAERKKVHEAKGVPVFDAHSLEALMEKF